MFTSISTAAAGDLQVELKSFAGQMEKVLRGLGYDSVAVGEFPGPPNFPTSGGPAIAKTLCEEFERLGISVKSRASCGLKGEYLLTEVSEENSPDEKVLAIRISAQLVDQFGQPITKFEFDQKLDGNTRILKEEGKFQTDVRGEKEIVELMGLPSTLPTRGTKRERDQSLREGLVRPPVHLGGSGRISASSQSPFFVEILVNGHVRPPELQEDLPFVSIGQGEKYEIRITNHAAFDAAVAVTIDGLSVFSFSTIRDPDGQPAYKVYVIPAGSSRVIRGWHVTNSAVDSFLVTDYASSAAGTLRQTASLGTITVCFHAAWPSDQPPPPDEPPQARGLPNATARGPREGQKVDVVQRRIGVLRESVSVRYSR